MTKNNILPIVTISLLALNLLQMSITPKEVIVETDQHVETRYEAETIQDIEKAIEVTHEAEQWIDPMVSIEIKALERNLELTENDVYNLVDEDGLFDYLPLRAFKAEYNGLDYYYLSDSAGAIYISFDELVDGGNYILEVGIYSDIMYRLEEGYYNFSDEYEEAFIEFEELDKEGAEKLIINEFIL